LCELCGPAYLDRLVFDRLSQEKADKSINYCMGLARQRKNGTLIRSVYFRVQPDNVRCVGVALARGHSNCGHFSFLSLGNEIDADGFSFWICTQLYSQGNEIVGIIIHIIIVFIGTVVSTAFTLFWLTTIAKLLLFLAGPILFSSEFLMRRIAESPKGPVLALSGLTGGIAGLLKLVVG
jgi:hypothetical protein